MSSLQMRDHGADIAITGIGCRFPGADSPVSLWRMLADSRSAVGEMSHARLRGAQFQRVSDEWLAEPALRHGGYLHDIDAFDAAFFGLSRRQAVHMDPQQRVLLEVVWEAVEDAGFVPDAVAGSQTGVFVALTSGDYERMQYRDMRELDMFVAVGGSRNAAAAQVANVLGLTGPALVVDTDRSASLVAVHLACQSLRAGECQQAIVGAASLILSPEPSLALARSGLLSKGGKCRFASPDADGFVRSEGVAAVVLKLVSAALRDRDPIYAIIRGSALNSDGNRSGDLMKPSVAAQASLLAMACRDARVTPADIDYVEAHGTGTPVGDEVELAALGAVLGRERPPERPCFVGSVKTNIGHTEACAGLAGLIKVALALTHRQWPASLHCDPAAAEAHLSLLRLALPSVLVPWSQGPQPALAGVSAFGLTGTNAHVVIQEWRAPGADSPAEPEDLSGAPQQFVLSADTHEALKARVGRLLAWLSADGSQADLNDLSYTLWSRRNQMQHRLVVTAQSREQLRQKLRVCLEASEPPQAEHEGAGEKAVVGSSEARACLRLPTYPWQRERYWYADSGAGNAARPDVRAETTVAVAPVEGPSNAGASGLSAALRTLPKAERRERLASFIEARLAMAMGQPLGSNRTATFNDRGLTSLMLLETRQSLSEELQRALRPTLLLEYPSVDALVDYLMKDEEVGVRDRPIKTRSPLAAAAQIETRAIVGTPEPIAIIGIGCRFPGGVDSLESFWRLLSERRDPISEIPANRWPSELFFDPNEQAPGMAYSKWGGFLPGIDQFDPQFFGIAPREAERMDPQQRLLLEVAWEAFEHAGYAGSSLFESRTGVFVGVSNSDDYASIKRPDGRLDTIGPHDGTGDANSIAAGRLAYVLGLRGPCLAVDTACSSSLVAIHLACQSLWSGESAMAIAGGVNVMLTPRTHVVYSKARMLSRTGRCRTFDANADGYVRSEGCGLVVLRRLADAVAAGDNILAVVLGSAVNQDGRSNGLTAPSLAAQKACLRDAYTAAGVDPTRVSYVEAHGTGTPLGDPIEVQALQAVVGAGRTLGDEFVLGALKTNIGHLEAASGVAGLIKAVLCLQHGKIPANLHLDSPNPLIDWEHVRCRLPDEVTPWSAPERIAGVSSFGFSGTNAHLVVAEAPREPTHADAPGPRRPLHLLTVSAASSTALDQLVERYCEHLDAEERAQATSPARETDADAVDPVGDVCFTANVGRAHWKHRRFALGATFAELRDQLARPREIASVQERKVVFAFTGQGSQYAQMGRQLYEVHPFFKRQLDECSDGLRAFLPRPLLEVMFEAQSPASELEQTAYAQPALFALGYSLAKLWQSWGVEPAAVLGHSVGELCAACVAGSISLADGLRLIAHRGRLMQGLPAGGSMRAVVAGAPRVLEELAPFRDSVSIAAINAPNSTVISGERRAVEAVAARLAASGIKSVSLQVSHAFHSPLMEPIVGEFEEIFRGTEVQEPRVPLFSNLSGGRIRQEELSSPHYWGRHIREPVRFADSIEQLWQLGYRTFVEIGPRPVLLPLAKQCVDGEPALWLPSLRTPHSDWAQLLESLGTLYGAGVDVDWSAFESGERRRRVPLPSYPFQRSRHWAAELPRRALPPASNSNVHPLLSHQVSCTERVRIFEGSVSVGSLPLLSDHQLHGVRLVPAAVLLDALLSAATTIQSNQPLTVSDFVIQRALALPDELAERTVQILLTRLDERQWSADIVTRSLGDAGTGVAPSSIEKWTQHASARLVFDQPFTQEPQARSPLTEGTAQRGDWLYESLERKGLMLGPSMQAVETFSIEGDNASLRLRSTADDSGWPGGFLIPPALLDAGFQLLANHADPEQAFVPVSLARLQYHPRAGNRLAYCHVRWRTAAAGSIWFEDEQGNIVLSLENIDVKAISRGAIERLAERDAGEVGASAIEPVPHTRESPDLVPTWQLKWSPQPAAKPVIDAGLSRRWLVLDDGVSSLGDMLATALGVHGQHVQRSAPVPAALDEVARSGTCRGVVYLVRSASEASHDDHPASQSIGSCAALLHLLQAIQAVEWQGVAPTVWVVTCGAQSVRPGEALADLACSSLWGLTRVFFEEHPMHRGGLIDLDARDVAARGASGLLEQAALTAREILGAETGDHVAFRDETRYVLRLASAPTHAVTEILSCSPDGTYLITGGLGGIGRHVTVELARRGAGQIALVGRREATEADLEFQHALAEQYGTQLLVLTADVSDPEQLARVFQTVKRTDRPVRGVVHLAGVLSDAALHQQSQQSLSKVMGPKAVGAWNLHIQTRGLALDFFVLFSSVSGLVGNRGQANYAAASCFLDGLAHHRRALEIPALSLDWGPWSEVGMASENPRSRQLETWGISTIAPAKAGRTLERVLDTEFVQLVLSTFDLSTLAKRAVLPRLFLGLTSHTAHKEPPKAQSDSGLIQDLARMLPQDRRDLLTQRVRTITKEILGLNSVDELAPYQPLNEMGLDSLLAIDVTRALEVNLGSRLPVDLLLRAPSVEDIVDYIDQQVA